MTTNNLSLPPTVNLHIVGHCNFGCRFCYARFEKAKQLLSVSKVKLILDALPIRGVTRVTFAGGEPTLHPGLLDMLRHATEIGLVTSVVTNASRVDADWCRRHLPWVRWLVVSCDSANRATCDDLGRMMARDSIGQPDRVLKVCQLVHTWNAGRSSADRVRLKLNMVVTRLNVDEDPTAWIRACEPERVKLLQCLVVPGENDDAADLACSDEAFAQFAERLRRLDGPGLRIVAETTQDLHDSYAMVDPMGRFRQSHPSGYLESQPIDEVGIDTAWKQVGGCDLERFATRGGIYDHGEPCHGKRAPIVALEGLDGSGKSTLVTALADALRAEVVRCPPESMCDERVRADALGPADRRAFYWRGNEEAMRLAIDHVFAGRTVVMDRSYASTAAYATAEQGTVARPDDIPRGVARPDLVVFLELPESERRKRLGGRPGPRTPEEARLAEDAEFRSRVIAGYRTLGCVFVDASGSVESTLAAILRVLAELTSASPQARPRRRLALGRPQTP